MKSLKNCFNVNDELYTPKILVEPIVKYIGSRFGSFQIILFPFDKKQSEYVLSIKNSICSHIETGKDFFSYEKSEIEFIDIIIINPPFSRKLDVFKKLNELWKPYAMLMNAMALNYQEIANYFSDNPVQLLFFDKKVSFDGNTSSFSSCYVCKDFLPKDLIFEHLSHNNTGKNFIPSRMYECKK